MASRTKRPLTDPVYLQEELNRRSIFLRMRRSLLWIPLCALLGAALCWLLYTGVAKLRHQQVYETTAKLYIDFAVDGRGDEADYFNGATWTDLLTAHPDIFVRIEEGFRTAGLNEEKLPEGETLAYVRNHVRAEILSDVRLMTLTVDGPDAALTEAAAQAVSQALVAFGDSAKEFDKITLLSTRGPERVLWNDRSRNAILLGAALGLIAGAFFLWLRVVLDDAVYLPEDAERRYGLPVLGVTCRKAQGAEAADEKSALPVALSREMEENLNYLFLRTEGKAAVIAPEGPAVAERLVRALPAQQERFFAADAQDYETLRAAGRVILALSYGAKDAALVDHILSQAQKQGCPVRALFLADADAGFLSSYYRIRS